MVAFANTDGGHLFIGVDDNLTIPGLKYPEEAHYELEKAIHQLCKPSLEYQFEFIKTPLDTSVVHYIIPSSEVKPHYAFLETHHRLGKVFVRIEDKTVQASREYRSFLKRKQKKHNGPISYGDHEKLLLNYLGENQKITLSEFSEISHLPEKVASETLIGLASNNIIRIIPREREDWFVSSE